MFACHLDMNFAAFKKTAVKRFLELAAEAGFDTVVWEIEDKVRLDGLGSTVHPDAFSKAEFRELLAYARSLHLKSIPLLQTLGHAEYVLKHPEYVHLKENGAPDCYCVSKPEVRSFLKNLLNEIAELFDNPEYFHLGGDEAYNFGTCPVCSAQDGSALFVEHETELAEVLVRRGIRPCLWADMVRHHSKARQLLDRRFVIWLWNYSYTTEWADQTALREAGFDLVICPASSSGGDSPFLPRWNDHRDNIAGAAATALAHDELGLCITSWSIRMGLKCTQMPLWLLASELYLKKADFAETENRLRREYFPGADPEVLGEWNYFLMTLSGVQWNRYKDGTRPPAGRFLNSLEKNSEIMSELLPRLPEMIRRERNALSGLHADSALAELVLRGMTLKVRYLEFIFDLLTGRKCSLGRLREDREEFARFLATEQTDRSARWNAGLIYDPLIEYAEVPVVSKKENIPTAI